VEEVEFLCRILNQKFGLSCWPRSQKDGIQIYISGKSYEVLRELIYSHLILDMYYKTSSGGEKTIIIIHIYVTSVILLL